MGTFASNSSKLRKVGLFGGTFDPVHRGHVAMAQAAIAHLQLDELRLIPCHHPPHRDRPQLSSEQRIQLLSLAVEGYPLIKIDDRELRRDGPSWTVDTLRSFREQWGDSCSLILLMGADAYGGLTQWHQWQSLRELAHIGVFVRPGYGLPQDGVLAEWMAESANAQAYSRLASAPHGSVIAIDQPPIPISATEIRQQLASGLLPDSLPEAVRDYIAEQRLYGYKPKIIDKS